MRKPLSQMTTVLGTLHCLIYDHIFDDLNTCFSLSHVQHDNIIVDLRITKALGTYRRQSNFPPGSTFVSFFVDLICLN